MGEVITRNSDVQSGSEQPEIKRFLAPFEAVAQSLRHRSVNLPTLQQLLWQQRPLEEGGFFDDEGRFRRNLETVVATAREKGLVKPGCDLTSGRKGSKRLVPIYNGREIRKLGVVVHYWQEDTQATAMNLVPLDGRWERIRTNSHNYSPDLFGLLPLPSPSREESLLEEPDLYLEMRAEDLEKRYLYFSLMTRGKEFNWVDGFALEGGRVGVGRKSWEFVKKARRLWLVLRGDTQAVENDDEINNNALLQVLADLRDHLEQNNCTFGEAIAAALHQ